jgi:hypothetical protein
MKAEASARKRIEQAGDARWTVRVERRTFSLKQRALRGRRLVLERAREVVSRVLQVSERRMRSDPGRRRAQQ